MLTLCFASLGPHLSPGLPPPRRTPHPSARRARAVLFRHVQRFCPRMPDQDSEPARPCLVFPRGRVGAPQTCDDTAALADQARGVPMRAQGLRLDPGQRPGSDGGGERSWARRGARVFSIARVVRETLSRFSGQRCFGTD